MTTLKKLGVLIVLLTTTVALQAQLTVKGEVRTRTMIDHGALGLGSNGDADPGIFTGSRAALYFDYKMDKLSFHISPQATRNFGTDNTAAADDDLGIFQAFAKYQMNDLMSLKVGKQMVSYDDQRYLGGLRWTEQGRTFDAMTLGFAKGGTTVTIPVVTTTQAEGGALSSTSTASDTLAVLAGGTPNGNTVIQTTSSTTSSVATPFKFAMFPHLNHKFDGGKISVLAAPLWSKDQKNNVKFTTGVTGDVKVAEKVKLGGSFYYQGGSITTAAGTAQDVSAFQGSLFANFKPGKTSLTVGGEYLSGQDDSDTKTGFSPDFGTNHKFNGLMDHFYVGAAPAAGLIDLHAKTKTKLGEKSALVANAHYFLTASDPEKTTLGTTDGSYGAEVDLVYVLNATKGVNFKFGYSQFVGATETMEAFRGGDKDAFSGLGWIMMTFKPTLFKG